MCVATAPLLVGGVLATPHVWRGVRPDPLETRNKVGTDQLDRSIVQVFPGIYRDKTMADNLMYIPKDNTQNYPFCRLKLVVKTLKH